MPTIYTTNFESASQMIKDLEAKGIKSSITVKGVAIQEDIDHLQEENIKKIASGHGAKYSKITSDIIFPI